ncbi:MAG: TIGR01777 family protein [Flavobacteriales bacterium]|nr:TIGR01777 family protein [Flavobacteriales bacterium]
MAVFTITGATGSVGKEIVKHLLVMGHEVRILSTRKNLDWKGASTYFWNPSYGEIDDLALEGCDHLIHLAGASVSKRWTAPYKAEINDSRVYTSKVLLDSINRVQKGPKSCVSASAIGYYGSSQSSLFTEHTPPASDFLASVTENWERYTKMFASPERRSIQLRIGIVLDKGAGVLGKLVPLAKAGIASPLGTGKQWTSWIHVEDLAKMFVYCAISDVVSGPYNAVASTPLSNRSFTKKICKVLRRPMILPSVPAFILKLVLGEMATLALMSQKVSNAKILEAGFVFTHEDLESALHKTLK